MRQVLAAGCERLVFPSPLGAFPISLSPQDLARELDLQNWQGAKIVHGHLNWRRKE